MWAPAILGQIMLHVLLNNWFLLWTGHYVKMTLEYKQTLELYPTPNPGLRCGLVDGSFAQRCIEATSIHKAMKRARNTYKAWFVWVCGEDCLTTIVIMFAQNMCNQAGIKTMILATHVHAYRWK